MTDINAIPRYSLSDLEREFRPMWHHKAGLQYTRSGYGNRIPTPHMVKLPGKRAWRRVYVCIFSNAGTAYVGKPRAWEAIIT